MHSCGALTRRSVLFGIGAGVCALSRAATHTRSTQMPRFIEVSHVIEPGMVTYPGLP